MASSSSNPKALESVYASLTLEEEDEGGLEFEDESTEVKEDYRYILVGKLLTEKPIKFNIMKDTLAAIWRPGRGMSVKELAVNRVLFQFFHDVDLKRILEDGPWFFEQSLLVLRRLEINESLFDVQLTESDFWVQIHNLPVGFLSEKIVEAIGSYVGVYKHADKSSFDGSWKAFLRIRVSIDVTKPLKHKMKIKKTGGEWIWIDFKYERLPNFCFICGILGHGDRFCPKLFEGYHTDTEKSYGPWMRATGRRPPMTTGQQWLVSETPNRRETEGAGERQHDISCTVGRGKVEISSSQDQSGKESSEGTNSGSTIQDVREKLTVVNEDKMDLGQQQLGQPNNIDEQFFVDQKRRRMEDAMLVEEPRTSEVASSMNSSRSKNGLMAGPVSQARPEK